MKWREYIDSPEWSAKRGQYKSSRSWVCFACGEKEQLHLHHLTYERLGSERLDDLIPLCQPCHAAAHQLVKRRGVRLAESHIALKDWLADGNSLWIRGKKKQPKKPKQTRKKRQWAKSTPLKGPHGGKKKKLGVAAENERLHAIQQRNRERRA